MQLKTQTEKAGIKTPFLWPIGLGLLALLLSSVLILSQFQEKNLETEVRNYADYVSTMFYEELEHETQDMAGLVEILQEDRQLQQSWLEKDVQGLLDRAGPFFENVCAKQDITHYYFHDLDRSCFLRVHQPQRRGDMIRRQTLDHAAETGLTASGIELGPMGTFTLRLVKPWRIDGQVQGYLELGKEIDHITGRINRLLGVELLFIINKEFLDRSSWEDGMAMLHKAADWDEFKQFALVAGTLTTVPPEVADFVRSLDDCRFAEPMEAMLPHTSLGDRQFRGKPVCLIDASGEDVGAILVLVDVSSRQAAIGRLSSLLIAAYAVMFSILFGILYVHFRNVGRRLKATYRDLGREIQEHQQTKTQIERQNLFLSNVIESMTHPFYVVDVDTYEITLSNTSARRQNLTSGRTCYSATHGLDRPCDSAEEPCPLQMVKNTRQPAIVEHVHHDAAGGQANVEIHCYPIFDADGKLTHAIEYALDINARKMLQNKLEEAKKNAEEASRLKSEFLANMSHEIRTPLNSIIGFGDLLQTDESLSREQRDYAETLVNNGRQLLTLINSILDLSKIEAGKIVLDFSELDVRALCKNLNAVLRPLAERKNIEWRIELADDLTDIVRTDQFRLQQCLLNLASNAIKFTPSGAVTMRFSMDEILGQRYLRIDVQDTGIGIPESKLDTIFEAFTQVDGSTTRQFGGTGLGLTITRKLVAMLGGEIFVRSSVGRGSVFSIQLPLQPPAPQEQTADLPASADDLFIA